MRLDGSVVKVGDRVHVLGRGEGKVTEAVSTSCVVTQPNGVFFRYSDNGVQNGSTHRTLYWRDPVVIAPLKDEEGWNKLVIAMREISKLFRSA